MKDLIVFLLKWFYYNKVDTILFTKHEDNDILIVQIYVDDIIFGSCSQFKSHKNFIVI